MAPLDDLGRVEISELSSGAVVVSANGPLDGRSCGLLRDSLLPLTTADAPLVVLDLTDARGVDDEALDVVARAATLFGEQGGFLVVVCRSRALNDRIRNLGLGDIVRMHDTLEDSLA